MATTAAPTPPVIAAPTPSRRGVSRAAAVRRILLALGIVSSLLYVSMDILAAMRYAGYSYTSQTISELSAIGVPTRPLLVPLGFAYSALVIAFGWGVWRSAGPTRTLRTMGGLLIGFGIFGFTAPFISMHQRDVLAAGGATLADTLHIVGAMVNVVFMLLIIGFGATVFGTRFRRYSIGTILVLLVFGALTGLDGPRVGANLPTPWVGVSERISVFSGMLWYAVLAVALLRAEAERSAAGRGGGKGSA